MEERFDILVIGAGPGGHAAAVQAARQGARVAIIERGGWGGTCTHRGCIPTKALLACSGRFAELKKIRRMGVNFADASFDYAAMKRHQGQIVKISALGVQKSLQDAGVAMIAGEGRIVSPQEVEWTAPDGVRKQLAAKDLIIAWGSEPALPPGVQPSAHILTSDGILSLPALPASILIVGGSVIGVEFATFFAELGVRVTLVEMLESLLPGEEPEASQLLTQELKKMGVAIHTGMRMETIRDTGSGVELRLSPAAPPAFGVTQAADPRSTPPAGIASALPLELSAELALISTGRKPSLRPDELDALGIRYDRRGIAVDGRQQTNIPGIHAIGDCTGGMMLAHRAMQQGKALAGRILGDPQFAYREEAVPAVVYTHPQIARIGLMEAEARRKGFTIEVRRTDYAANIIARAQLLGQGFVKLVFQGERLAGATIAGDQAGELIAPLSLAIAAGLGEKELRNWVIPHPTLSELLGI
ncbi:MAG: dihydrolipoyl dehydrogenase family protein [Syntrophales bacterium]